MRFDSYPIADEIKQNLLDMGFKKPTDIQYKAIPHILREEDVLAIAQTGTGKTAAFAIPTIHKIHRAKSSARTAGIKCLVMVPTRELAQQITEVFEAIAKHTNVKTYCLYGGVEQGPQIKRLQVGIDILITTPGRMFDLVSQGYIDLSKVETLILDEADHMLDLGFIKDIRDVIRFLPKYRQTLFFSATIDENIKKLAYSLVAKPFRIQISPKDPVSKNIDHAVTFVEMDDKRFFLERIIKEHDEKKILVFVRTRVRAERVAKALQRVRIEAMTIHGDKEQEAREEALGAFREGRVKILVATDVSARGIDIPNVDYVINYDLPEVPENYVHRVGRTGRGMNKGEALAFCSEEEKKLLAAIEQYIANPIRILDIDKMEYEKTVWMSEDVPDKWTDMMRQIEEQENFNREKKKKRKNRKRK